MTLSQPTLAALSLSIVEFLFGECLHLVWEAWTGSQVGYASVPHHNAGREFPTGAQRRDDDGFNGGVQLEA